MIRQFRPKEFTAALVERGYARNIGTARKYVRRHPQGFYTDSDFPKAFEWLEVEERYLFQTANGFYDDVFTEGCK